MDLATPDNTRVLPSSFSGILDVRSVDDLYDLTFLSSGFYNCVKPCFIKGEDQLQSCLEDFKVAALPRYGAKVVNVSDVDISILQRWNILRDWIAPDAKSLKEFLLEQFEAYLDPVLKPEGFSRRNKQFNYKKKHGQCEDFINIYRTRDAASHFIPVLNHINLDVHAWITPLSEENPKEHIYNQSLSKAFFFFDKQTAYSEFRKIAEMFKGYRGCCK